MSLQTGPSVSGKGKSFMIQAFRQQQPIDQNGANIHLKAIRDAIETIYDQRCSVLSFEQLYRGAYNLVLHKFGDFLYDGVGKILREHLQTSVDELLSTKNDDFLRVTVKIWTSHKVAFNMVKDILM